MDDSILNTTQCRHCGFEDSGTFCSRCGKFLSSATPSWRADFIHATLPIEILYTVINLIWNHRRFFASVKSNDFRRIAKPVPFFVACIVAAIFIETSANLPYYRVLWSDLYMISDTLEDDPVMFEALELNDWLFFDFFPNELFAKGSSSASRHVYEIVGSLDSGRVVSYIRQRGIEENRPDFLLLARRLDAYADEWERELEVQSFWDSIVQPFAMLLSIWLVGSRLLAKKESREFSFSVLCYCTGLAFAAFTVVEAAVWHVDDNLTTAHNIANVSLIPLWIWTYRVINHTHGVGWWRQQWIVICSSLSGALIFLLFSVPFSLAVENIIGP